MKIETKFNVGDKVVFLSGTKLNEKEIHSIDIEILENSTNIRYCFKNDSKYEFANESNVFASIEEFLSQLTNNIIEMEIDFNYILKKIKDDE